MYGQPGMPGMHGPGMGHPGMHGQGMGQPEMHLPGAGEQECTNQARMDQVWVIQDIIKYLQSNEVIKNQKQIQSNLKIILFNL